MLVTQGDAELLSEVKNVIIIVCFIPLGFFPMDKTTKLASFYIASCYYSYHSISDTNNLA